MNIYAPATAPGGAIGFIRVSGPGAVTAVNAIFSRDITNVPARQTCYGNIVHDGDIIDDVLVTKFIAPNSYTGEDSVEISHHASPYITQVIFSLLDEQDCRMAEPGEFTKRAYLNGKLDLAQAEAVADLISAQSAAAHRIAIKQMKGSISQRLDQLAEKMVQLISLLELELDFSEEDIEFADRTKLLTLSSNIADEIKHLINTFATGNAIKNGVPVAIIGAPNVGKSTLLNKLLGEERAIVSNIQGTTRDIIEDAIQIKGITYRFIDTAGIRDTDDQIEQLGIQRTLQAIDRAQIIIKLTEPGVPFVQITPRADQTVISIVNKTQEFRAIDGHGIPALLDRLHQAVRTDDTYDVVISNTRHKTLLTAAYDSILHADMALTAGSPIDLVVEDLKTCIDALNQISGKSITPDLILHNIFQNFCIGK